MLILGIDPGTAVTGYGLVRQQGARLILVGCGGIRAPARRPAPEKLHTIYEALLELVRRYRPACAAVESLFFARNVRSALTLGQARGVALLAAVQGGLPVFEYTPREVKAAITGYGAAEKEQVRGMVTRLLALQDPPASLDATDALALAICHCHVASGGPGRRLMASRRGLRVGRAAWRALKVP
ncbi:MAG TPA: crossover junction endodeoxyribonuclease RuvC [Candidatus Methylomirabilis sp.]|nr:crossover junction endodeoxyribonuclease RuvC [Candidatus Methylomirabilis sp.]